MGEAEDVEAAEDGASVAHHVAMVTAWCGMFSAVLTLAYLADVVSHGKISDAAAPYVRRAQTRGRELVTSVHRERELVLAGRRLVWDACEAVMDADPEWWAQVRGAA